MTIIIRRVIESDLFKISELFDGRRGIEELKWLFRNHDDPNKYNAFVALNQEKNVVGVIAYMILDFYYKGSVLKGVLPNSWMISTNYRGFAGIMLLKKVLEYGDFGYGIRGSQMAQNLFLKFKYTKVAYRHSYNKIFKPIKFFVSGKESNIKKPFFSEYSINKAIRLVRIFPTYILSFRKFKYYKDVELIPYEESESFHETNFPAIFEVKISKNFIKWLSECPVANSYAYSIKQGGKIIGTCVLYIKEKQKVKFGRIVYLSYLGNDKKLWNSVISKIIKFFESMDCNSVDTIGLNLNHVNCLKRFGFIKSTSSQPIFIRDENHIITDVQFSNMYTQYIEGDKVYRGF